jgi:hypothetical protein
LVTVKHYTYVEENITITSAPSNQKYGVIPLTSFMDYIEIRRCYFDTYFTELVKTTMAMEAERNPYWRVAIGLPERWFLYDGETIAIVPYSGAQLSGFPSATVGYIQSPVLLSANTDTVDTRIPYAVQNYIKYAAASWLLSLDQTDTTALQTAKTYMDTFISLIGE